MSRLRWFWKARRKTFICTSNLHAHGAEQRAHIVYVLNPLNNKHCSPVSSGSRAHEEIGHCTERLPLAAVNLISTKDGEQVLTTDPRDKNMERERANDSGGHGQSRRHGNEHPREAVNKHETQEQAQSVVMRFRPLMIAPSLDGSFDERLHLDTP